MPLEIKKMRYNLGKHSFFLTLFIVGLFFLGAVIQGEQGLNAGGTSSSVIDDNVLPTVSIISPTEFSTLSGIVTVMGTAHDSDGAVDHVEVSIDRGDWFNATGTTNWTYEWDTTLENNGECRISAQSYDGIDSSNVTFIDVMVNNTPLNTPPTINITSPLDGNSVAGLTTITGFAYDSDDDPLNITLRIDEGDWMPVALFMAPPYISWSYQWNTSLVSDGSHTITVKAYDGQNYSDPLSQITVSVHNTFTMVSMSPLSQVIDPGDIFTVNITILPHTPIMGIQCNLSFNSTFLQAQNVSMGNFFEGYSIINNTGTIDNINGTITRIFSAIYLSSTGSSVPGTFVTITFSSRGIPGVGFLELSNVIVVDEQIKPVPLQLHNGSVTILADTLPPQINTIGFTPDTPSSGGYVNITYNVTDNQDVDTVKLNITGPLGFQSLNVTMDKRSYYYNATYPLPGLYSFFIWVNDTNGNVNISEIYTFEISDYMQSHVSFNNLSVPITKLLVGDQVNLSVNVTNTGEKGGNLTLFLYINASLQPSVNTRIWLDANETKRVSLESYPLMNPGIYTVTVGNSTSLTEDCEPLVITVHVPPLFSFTNLSIQPGIILLIGASPTIYVNVTNSGGMGGNVTLFLYVNDSRHYGCNTTIWLDANETKQASIESHPLMNPGICTVTVGNKTNPIEYLEPLVVTIRKPPQFTPLSLTVSPQTILRGESVTLHVNVTNTGDIDGYATLFLYINDTPHHNCNRTVFIQSGETKTIILVVHSIMTPGLYNVTVGNKTSTSPNLEPVMVTVLMPPTFIYANLNITPSDVPLGAISNMSVTVTNIGDIGGNITVFLYINGSIHYGCNRTLSLNANEAQTINFSIHPLMTPGIYNVSVGNESGPSPDLDLKSLQVTDSIPPEIININLLAPFQMPGGWINISAIITDNHHIDQVFLYMTLPNGSKKNYSLLENTTDNTTYYCNQTYHVTGYFTFYIRVHDPSGNHINSSLYQFWFYETTQSKIINTGENTIDASQETGVFLYINSTSNTTVTISRYPHNPYPDATQEMGLVSLFLELNIANTTAIEWPINLTFFFTSNDVTNSGMNTSQLLGIFYWNETVQSWHKYSHTGVNLTEFNGYTGSSWVLIDHLTTLVIGGDISHPTCTITYGPMGQITDTDVLFEWMGNDDYTPPSLIEYQYKLEGYETSWSPWTTSTSKNYYDLVGGTYTFHIQARDKAGNIAIPLTRSFTVPLNQPPVANFSWAPTKPTDLESVTFLDNSEDSDGSIINWTWDFGDETIAYGEDVDHLYTINGIYTVTLKVKDNDEETNVIQKTIEIFNVAPSALFNYSLDDRTVSFTDESTDTDGTITSWYWEFDDDHYSVTSNPVHSYEKEGKYTVILTVTDDDMDSDIYTTTITIEDEGGIPGFELLTLLGALIIIYFYKRK